MVWISWLVMLTAFSCRPAPEPGGDARARDREKMVTEQIATRDVRDERTLAAMRAVPRHLFVPEALRHRAYQDTPLLIGDGQTISAPGIVAAMTEALALRGDERVLEIGTGSGYQAAILSRLVGSVVSIERIPRGHGGCARLLAEPRHASPRPRVCLRRSRRSRSSVRRGRRRACGASTSRPRSCRARSAR